MTKKMAFAWTAALVALVAVAVPAGAQEAEKGSVVVDSPEWQKLKSLAGHWEGFVEFDGKKVATHVEMRLTGDGSAVMHVMDRDTPHEMVTMFHPDGKRLLATHYCAAHNQPRMALIPSKGPNQITFDFVDGTNIARGDHYMKRIVLTIPDADHHDIEWTSMGGDGKESSAVFHYTRVKK
jgi:hypothetical protein